MSRITWHLPRIGGVAAILIGATLQAADPVQETSHAFEVKVDSVAEQAIGEKKQKLDASTEMRYVWHRRGRERTLSYDSMRVRASMDGNEIHNVFLSRNKFINTTNGKTEEILIEKAPSTLKTMLEASFNVPLCKLEVDENGDETKRTILAGHDAELLLKNGAIANACLIHPTFQSQKNEWSAKAEMSLGTEAFVTGSLNYKKVPGTSELQAVIVSGVLTNDSFNQPGTNVVFKETRYVVNGKQTFDRAQKEWVSGEQTVVVTYRIIVEGMSVGSASGKITITFKQLPSKTK